ncbi:serine/threonine-protein kinase [Streptomyces sp. NPDC058662]|uniref:serine/threonine-protein kinase n=1 Tax=Streptomyces sp. NPDC058662 TaxID=3346583 RepID=UPI00364C4C40
MHCPADTSGSDRTEPLPRGYRIGGWEVTEPIATGGWATVYAGRASEAPGEEDPTGSRDRDRARGQDREQDVALKFLPTSGLAPRQAREVAAAAGREIELGRRAGHPRLIRLLDRVVLSEPDRPHLDGAIVLVMERARASLRDRLDAAALTEADAGRLLTEICEGLAHLHGSGWVHGDLKPDNVLLMEDGSVKLSDFGLATELTGSHGTHGYAPPMGTLDYLPPERWRAPLGEHGVQVRPSADIWALGIMIHELFASGASPFPGATPGARGAAIQEYADGRAQLRMDNAVPPFWRGLAADCLAPTHAARAVHTAQSLLARMETREDRAPDPVPGPRPAEHARPARRRRRAAVLAGAAVAATAALWPYPVGDGASGAPGRVGVYNAEQQCRDRTDRDPQCSLGLAVDPRRPYTADNVVPTRVWHGDVLAADCRLPEGMPVIDEDGAHSTDWYRVRLPPGSAPATAWLPAVRTKDRPQTPRCPRAASG